MTTVRNHHWPQPDSDTRREHRVKWFVWVTSPGDFGGQPQRVPHASSMHDPDFGQWDAECACGQWESKTGGRPRTGIQDMAERHRSEVQWQKMCAAGLIPPGLLARDPEPAVLGEGVLRWSRAEAVSGRYGTVMLQSGEAGPFIYPASVPEGRRGFLEAEILGIPGRGTQLAVGEGYVFRSRSNGNPAIGVRPHLGTDVTDEQAGQAWMDPDVLHALSGRMIRLVFFPAGRDA